RRRHLRRGGRAGRRPRPVLRGALRLPVAGGVRALRGRARPATAGGGVAAIPGRKRRPIPARGRRRRGASRPLRLAAVRRTAPPPAATAPPLGYGYPRRFSSVTRPVSTHSTTKTLPALSKQASCGCTNLPGFHAFSSRRMVSFLSARTRAESSPRCAITLL